MPDYRVVDHQILPGSDQTLYLVERAGTFEIQVDGRELMTDQEHGSEDALADWAIDLLPDPARAQVLVGGLGMGFTLAAALRRVGAEGGVTVAELMPAVVLWNQRYVGGAAGHPLKDPRASVHLGDVGDLVEHDADRWDAILLDVDNGPEDLTCEMNGWLYSEQGVAAAYKALRPGGVLGIWSAGEDPWLGPLLLRAGFVVEMRFFNEVARRTPDSQGNHVVWMAQRPGAGRHQVPMYEDLALDPADASAPEQHQGAQDEA